MENHTATLRDNEENPLRGIETSASPLIFSTSSVIVTMKRIPFGGLKLEDGAAFHPSLVGYRDNEENPLRGIETARLLGGQSRDHLL